MGDQDKGCCCKHEESGLRQRVETVLGEIRPRLQNDGGDIELVDVKDDGIVTVRLKGACCGCPMSQMTLKNGVERYLRERVPEVTSVQAAA